jgi:predicted nucleic acid-binding protein
MTSFVQYECLIKPRKSISPSEQKLMNRLDAEQSQGAFLSHSCSIEDLQEIELLEKRQNLGKGELSSIAFAKKIRQGFITDDRKALKFAKELGHPYAQTTPHLFSWLIFTGRLGDSDKDVVIDQHIKAGRDIAPHLQKAYEIALQFRLNSTVRT